MSDSFATPWAIDCQFLYPWDFPSRITELGCQFVLQGIFLTQGSNPYLLHWQVGSLALSHQGRHIDICVYMYMYIYIYTHIYIYIYIHTYTYTHIYTYTHMHIYPLFFGFPFLLGHHRALSRVPCARQQVLVSYLC